MFPAHLPTWGPRRAPPPHTHPKAQVTFPCGGPWGYSDYCHCPSHRHHPKLAAGACRARAARQPHPRPLPEARAPSHRPAEGGGTTDAHPPKATATGLKDTEPRGRRVTELGGSEQDHSLWGGSLGQQGGVSTLELAEPQGRGRGVGDSPGGRQTATPTHIPGSGLAQGSLDPSCPQGPPSRPQPSSGLAPTCPCQNPMQGVFLVLAASLDPHPGPAGALPVRLGGNNTSYCPNEEVALGPKDAPRGIRIRGTVRWGAGTALLPYKAPSPLPGLLLPLELRSVTPAAAMRCLLLTLGLALLCGVQAVEVTPIMTELDTQKV